MIKMKDHEFDEIVPYMYKKFGINLKQKRGLMEGRLSLRITERGFNNYSDYFKSVLQDKSGKELSNLINVLTTNYTFFFREIQHFDFLKNTALLQICNSIKDNNLRIWSAGCSSGEEPYTIAMVLDEYFGLQKRSWQSKVTATDISGKVLDLGVEGIYSSNSLKTLTEAKKNKYFTKIDDEKYQAKDLLKNEVTFSKLNLMDTAFPFKKKFHIIFCRNVMIYFDAPTKANLIKKFYENTEPGGYLFIGHAESIVRGTSGYEYVQPAVFRKPL